MAAERHRELNMGRVRAAALGHSAVGISRQGFYRFCNSDGTTHEVDLSDAVAFAMSAKQSLEPTATLPKRDSRDFPETTVQVTNETTLGASRRLIAGGLRPLALNFANGISPGGGFLHGARAQEENLCRSSALYLTLEGDPMYEAHLQRPRPDSTDWMILSPDVPVFREDDGTDLEQPWNLSFLTSAAPVASRVGMDESAALLRRRIHRVLAVARAFDYGALVLGAWGCGAFGNDPRRTAEDFREALQNEYAGAFSDIVFAITDWSPERKFLGPFRDVFLESAK